MKIENSIDGAVNGRGVALDDFLSNIVTTIRHISHTIDLTADLNEFVQDMDKITEEDFLKDESQLSNKSVSSLDERALIVVKYQSSEVKRLVKLMQTARHKIDDV